MIMINLEAIIMTSTTIMRKFVEGLEEIVNGCGEEIQPEEKLAELLASLGLIRKSKDRYVLTDLGKRFIKLTSET